MCLIMLIILQILPSLKATLFFSVMAIIIPWPGDNVHADNNIVIHLSCNWKLDLVFCDIWLLTRGTDNNLQTCLNIMTNNV